MRFITNSTLHWKQWAADAIAFSLFGLIFLTKYTTITHHAILIIGLLAFIFSKVFRSRWISIFSNQQFRYILYPFIIWFIASLAISLIHKNDGTFSFPSNALIIILSTIVFCFTPSKHTHKFFIYGIACGAILAFSWGLFYFTTGNSGRNQGPTNNPIYFGNISALIMLFCLSIALLAYNLSNRLRTIFVILSILAGLASLTSQSRSSGLIIFCILPLLLSKEGDKFKSNLIKVLLGALTLSIYLAVTTISVQKYLRLDEITVTTETESQMYNQVTGYRYELWRCAWEIFTLNPLIGAGPDGFKMRWKKKVDSGKVKYADYFNQPHNDILHAASSGGVIKLIAYVLLIIGPFLFFYRCFKRLRIHGNSYIWSIMGMQLVGAFFLLGLTTSTFDIQIYSTVYSIAIAILALLSDNFSPNSEFS